MSNSEKTVPQLPLPGTLARRVLDFFHKNPLEEFDATDIGLKWSVSVGKVHTELAEALNAKLQGLKTARKGAAGLKTYIAGPLLEAAYDAAPPDSQATTIAAALTKPAKQAGTPSKKSSALPFDPASLKVRTDLVIPVPAKERTKNAWDIVLGKLTKPGQSIELPAEAFRSAVLACGLRKRYKHPGRFAVHRTSPATCAIFRLNDDGTVPSSIAPKA